MPATVKVTVSLPATLHRAAERERKARKTTRSQLFRTALEALLKQQRETEATGRYVQGYLAQPENDAEVSYVHGASTAVLVAEPWD